MIIYEWNVRCSPIVLFVPRSAVFIFSSFFSIYNPGMGSVTPTSSRSCSGWLIHWVEWPSAFGVSRSAAFTLIATTMPLSSWGLTPFRYQNALLIFTWLHWTLSRWWRRRRGGAEGYWPHPGPKRTIWQDVIPSQRVLPVGWCMMETPHMDSRALHRGAYRVGFQNWHSWSGWHYHHASSGHVMSSEDRIEKKDRIEG